MALGFWIISDHHLVLLDLLVIFKNFTQASAEDLHIDLRTRKAIDAMIRSKLLQLLPSHGRRT